MNPRPIPSEMTSMEHLSSRGAGGVGEHPRPFLCTLGVQRLQNWTLECGDGGIQWNQGILKNRTKMGFNGPSIERF